MYGSAARALRRGGGVKIFRWEGELQQKGSRHSYTRLLRTRRFIRINGIYLRRPPFLPYGMQLQYTAPTRHGDRTNHIRPGKSVMSLSFPILPDSLELPRGIPFSSIP